MATKRQKKAVALIAQNGGNVTKGMRDAGYSETTINNPVNLTKSNAWHELLAKTLPDELLQHKLTEGLNAVKRIEGDFDPDFAVRHKYIDTAYKLKDKYPAQRTDHTTGGMPFVQPVTDEQRLKLDNLI